MKIKTIKRILAVFCAAALLLALGACAPVETVKGWLSSDGEPYAGYNLDKLVKPGEYKGVEAQFTTEEGYLDLYMEEAVFAQYGAPKGIADDTRKETVAEGDLAYFDYEGTVEGATEDDLKGMKGAAMFIIGSGNFIEGFESQIVGQPRDKEFDVNVSFPEDYADENGEVIETLAGKPAVFKCTVHKIGAESEKITDEGVAALTGGQYATIAAFREAMQSQLEQQYGQPVADLVSQYNASQAFDAAFANAEILEIPAKEQKYWDEQLKKQAESQSMTPEEYLASSGFTGTLEDYNTQERDETIKRELFTYAVAEKEEITVTDEDTTAWLTDYRAQGATGTDEEIYTQIGGKSALLRWLMQNKVSEFIYENAKASPAAVS